MQGKIINGFILQRQLGMGGMAEVWYAENEIGMKAAVKIMSDELSRNAQMRERFLNEAKVMVKLDHPNIRKVHGYGEVDGRPAIIMEYLDGSDLKARMKSGQRFTDEELVKWWNQLVDALNYTHAQNIVHRDIKPSNIFVDQHGNVKLLDFGIAKVTETTTGTQTGSTLGTRIYMSPEQVKDPKRVGVSSDVYSLAVTFVHLLTGKAPYDNTTSNDYDIQVSIVTKPLDMGKVPEDWRSFLMPYLEKDPSKRLALRPFRTPTAPLKDRHGKKKRVDNHVVVKEDSDGEKTIIDEQSVNDFTSTPKGKSHWTPKRIKRLLLIAAVCALIVVFWGITGIKGRVTEEGDKELVLPGATIVAIHIGSGKEYYDIADQKGRYRIGFMLPGRYLIQCRFVGFQINEQKVYVLGRKKVDFAMDDEILLMQSQ